MRAPFNATTVARLIAIVAVGAIAVSGCRKRPESNAPKKITPQSVNKKTRQPVDKPAAATATNAAKAPDAPDPDRPFITFELPTVAKGTRGAVATAHPLATRAAAKALFDGGNAVDALVAASMMLAVVTPQSTGIGGGGFAIVAPGDDRPARAFDFRETGPRNGKRELYLDKNGGHIAKRSQRHGLAIGVPGYVKGLALLHEKYGARPWKDLVMPASETARRGFKVGDKLARAAAWTWKQLGPNAKKLLTRKGGGIIKIGDVLVQPALAKTLKTIAEKGVAGLYEGDVAADIVTTAQATGGKLDHEDMRVYKVRESEPLRGDFFGRQALTMPQPSAGGAQLLAMAELMAQTSRKLMKKPAKKGEKTTLPGLDQPVMMHRLVEAMRRSFLMRLAFSGDPDVKAKKLDDVYPRAVRRKLAAGFDAKKASESARIRPPGKLENHQNTSHVSIVDKDGMAVASTHTINLLFGSGILASNSGIFLNNELDDFSYTLKDSNAFGLAGSKANMYRPGRRPVSSMTPTIVLDNGKPRLVIGAPGGTRIPTAVFQVAYRHLVDGEPLKQAIDAPRLHHQAYPDAAWIEDHTGVQAKEEALAAFQHKTTKRAPWCDVQAVAVTRDKAGNVTELLAASDKRYEGGAMALK